MAYNAIVARIKTKPHPNADRIQLGDILGSQIVTSLDTKDGELGIYFPVDGILSVDFADRNGLLNASARERLGLAPSDKVGFFDHHRRVRAQKFRGEKSEGIWLPLSCLDSYLLSYHGAVIYPDTLVTEGYQFDAIEGQQICEKWVSRARVKGPAIHLKKKRDQLIGFPKHMDTEQWRYMWQQIPTGSLLTISEKLHGTSHRLGVIQHERGWIRRLLNLAPVWSRVDGSRNVVLTEHSGRASYYGTDQFRFRATPQAGRKGEVLFGEIVGYVDASTPIMPMVGVDKKELPEIYARYGDKMHYRYSQHSGQAEFFVYRIVQFNDDGDGVELSDTQMRRRAHQLGYRCPPLLGQWMYEPDRPGFDANFLVESLTEGESLLDQTHIREGVVVRVDTPDGHTYFLKNKSFAFKVLEGIIKSVEGYEDVEESA